MRPAFPLVIIAALAVTACGQPAPEPADAPPPVAPAAETPDEPRWIDGGDAAILVMQDARRETVISLACPQDQLSVDGATLDAIGSEDRLTLGVGGEAFALAAQPVVGEPGVRALGPAPEGLYAAIARAGPLSLNYGAQVVTAPQLPVDLAARFANACGGIPLEPL